MEKGALDVKITMVVPHGQSRLLRCLLRLLQTEGCSLQEHQPALLIVRITAAVASNMTLMVQALLRVMHVCCMADDVTHTAGQP